MIVDYDLRRRAAAETQGSPYMMQLIGHNLVRLAGDSGRVSADLLEEALIMSREAFEEDVCGTTLAALSDRDIDFLRAMVADEADSSMADIAKRMGVSSDYAQKYRIRLISCGVVTSPRRGHVAVAVPYLKEFLARLEA